MLFACMLKILQNICSFVHVGIDLTAVYNQTVHFILSKMILLPLLVIELISTAEYYLYRKNVAFFRDRTPLLVVKLLKKSAHPV